MSEIWKGFYVLEGIDGAGKTSAMWHLRERAKREGKGNVAFTAEPTRYGRAMLDAMCKDVEPCPDTLSYLFAADRNEHLYGKGGVRERIGAGRRVICDRYLFSSLVYQGIAGGGETARRLNGGFPLPEILFLFDISAKKAFERIKERGGKRCAFERLDFLRKAEEEYRRLGRSLMIGEWDMLTLTVDAEKDAGEIADFIWSEIWK